MHAAMALRKKDVPATLAALGRFGGFKPEPEQTVREQKVVASPVIEAMKRAWAENRHTFDSAAKQYHEVFGKIRKLEYSAKDIETFSLVIAEFQNENRFPGATGLFLSALINNSREDEFVIHTAHLVRPIYFLGSRNTKNITVDGDAGTYLGECMKGGFITIEGNAGPLAGSCMKGGTIIVYGNAGDHFGGGMKGGTITVEGDAGGNVGYKMKGGEIHLNGCHRGISKNIVHGRIFHKGKLIVDK